MRNPGPVPSGLFPDARWNLAGLVGLMVFMAFAIVPLTLALLQSSRSYALVVDMAGRQRMLLERHLKEILLVSQNIATDYSLTRGVMKERLAALADGGWTAARVGAAEKVRLPPAPNDAIRSVLLTQARQLDQLFTHADSFLALSPSDQGYPVARDALLKEHALLLDVAHEAVALLDRYSEAKVRALIRWEATFVAVVLLLGAFLAWLFVRTDRALRQSQAVAFEALRQSDALKTALLSSASHDLRTPLAAIKSMVFSLSAADHRESDPLHAEFLQRIQQEVDALDRLVGNLLDMSRIEAGAVVLQRECHLIEELIEGAVRRMGPALEDRRLHIELPRHSPPLFVDGVAIQQVLINLLDNAMKFSLPGSRISIEAKTTGEVVEVHVTNQGGGLPSGELDRIFDRFYRAQSPDGHAVPGTGLGLAICKGFIEAHGGTIEARSASDGATTVLFTLPQWADSTGAAPPTARTCTPAGACR